MGVKFGIQAEGDPKNDNALPEVSRVEVREQLNEAITYTVVFAEDVCEKDFQLLKHDSLGPCKELTIWVETDDKKIYLAKGPVQSQQIKLMNGGQGSEVQIKGTDNSVKMKHVERKANHFKEKDYEIVLDILGVYGFANKVFMDDGLLNDESKHSKVQNQDDLSFIKNLAGEHGAYFWISYDDDGNDIVNFNELPIGASPAVTFIINGDNTTINNIDEFNINWNTDVPTVVVGEHIDTKTKKKVDPKVDAPPQHKLGEKSLQQLTDKCKQEVKSSPKPVDDPGRAQKRSKGALNEAEWFIKASCSTSFDRICKVIHAHTVAKVEGAGTRHSGNYIVSGVTHTIDTSSYKMQIELMRNAWDPLVNTNGKQGKAI